LRRFLLVVILLFSCHALAADQKGQPSVKSSEKKVDRTKWEAPIKDPNNPNEVMQVKWDAIAKVLLSKELDQKARDKAINAIIDPLFDFNLMGMLTLSKTNRSKLSTPQKKKFVKLFTARLKDSYRDKISSYKDEKVEFKPAVKDKKKVRISMTIVSEDKKYTILYKLYRAGKSKSWKVYDMEIEGVSVIITYRSQFNDILSHDSVEDFLRQLEKKPASKTKS
jgi:phospholipid transport system substrate-binding protein